MKREMFFRVKTINLETKKQRRGLGWLVAVKDTGCGYRTFEFLLDWGGVFSGHSVSIYFYKF